MDAPYTANSNTIRVKLGDPVLKVTGSFDTSSSSVAYDPISGSISIKNSTGDWTDCGTLGIYENTIYRKYRQIINATTDTWSEYWSNW